MKYNDNDYLVVLKKDRIEDVETIERSFYIENDFTIDLWYLHYTYDNDTPVICNDFRGKLGYLLATMGEDEKILEVANKILPKIRFKNLPAERKGKGNNFKEWQQKLGITIEEFLINRKYVVVSCSYENEMLRLHLTGLMNYDGIDYIYKRDDKNDK